MSSNGVVAPAALSFQRCPVFQHLRQVPSNCGVVWGRHSCFLCETRPLLYNEDNSRTSSVCFLSKGLTWKLSILRLLPSPSRPLPTSERVDDNATSLTKICHNVIASTNYFYSHLPVSKSCRAVMLQVVVDPPVDRLVSRLKIQAVNFSIGK